MSLLPAFATVEDLGFRRPGGIQDADRPRAQAALDDASTLIRVEVASHWTEDDDIPNIFVTVACRAALRVFNNPDGIQQEALAAGYNATLVDASSDVYLTKTEKDYVRGAVGAGRAVFALATTRGPVETKPVGCGGGTVYLDTIPEGDPMPWTIEP